MPSPASLKRTYDLPGLTGSENTPPNTDIAITPEKAVRDSSEQDSTMLPLSSRDSSPLSSAATPAASIQNSPVCSSMGPGATIEGPPTKKRKLTFAEREAARIEKQFKDLEKAEERARKEAGKRQKEEQKKIERETEKRLKEEQKRIESESKEEKRRLQEEDRERKRKAKETEKAEKEESKRKKEAEKAKKDKAQLRLNAFFKKPAPSSGSAASSRRSSVASIESPASLAGSRAASELPDSILSEYEKAFPPFFLHAHTTIAPSSQFVCDAERTEWALAQIEKGTGDGSQVPGNSSKINSPKRKLDEVFSPLQGKRRKRYVKPTTVKNIIAQIHGSAANPIDLTSGKALTPKTPLEILRKIPVKYLRYAEDVRPPYIGTYTKAPLGHSMSKICRSPFTRALPTVNYDYDSEAEWEEPEEGEELGSEGEEEGEEDEGDDMEGFLDDGDVDGNGPKRRHIMGDMEPISSGLHWETSSPTAGVQIPFGTATIDLAPFRMDTLLIDPIIPIDPYSTSYWQPATPSPSSSNHATATATMAPPPRVPLHTLKGPNNMCSLSTSLAASDANVKPQATTRATAATKGKNQAPSKPISPELLEDFKRAIGGSDLTKAGLVEVLKKRFPQITKNTVLETLPQVAHRVGKKEADKKWCLL